MWIDTYHETRVAIDTLWEVFEVFTGHMDDSEVDCSKINIISLVNIESNQIVVSQASKILLEGLPTQMKKKKEKQEKILINKKNVGILEFFYIFCLHHLK